VSRAARKLGTVPQEYESVHSSPSYVSMLGIPLHTHCRMQNSVWEWNSSFSFTGSELVWNKLCDRYLMPWSLYKKVATVCPSRSDCGTCLLSWRTTK